MSMEEQIVSICWFIFLIYWILSARSVKSTKETKKEFSGFWLNAGRIFLIFLGFESFGAFPLYPLTIAVIPDIRTIQVTGIILTIAGLIVAIMARRTLAGNWSGNIELKKGHELIRTGVYKHIRHPIYTGIMLMSLGTLLFTGKLSAFMFFIVMTSFMLFKIKEEEELLMKHFPAGYTEYKNSTKALIPFLW